MNRRSGTREIVNLVDFQQNRLGHVVPDNSKALVVEQMKDIFLLPVKKLSRRMTSLPSARSRSQRCEPIKPAPPVTSILISFI